MDFTRHPDVVAAKRRFDRSLLPRLGERITGEVRDATRAAKRWLWFTTDRVDPRPHFAERVGWPVPRGREDRPKRPKARLGLDAQGRPLIFLRDDDREGELYSYPARDRAQIVAFNGYHAPTHVLVQRFERGQVVSTAWADFSTRMLERYTRDEHGRVVRVDVERIERDDRDPPRRFELTWEGKHLVEVAELQGRRREVTFAARAPKPPKLADLAATIEERLLVAVPAAVRRAKLRGQVAALALCYCYDMGCFPPDVGLLLAAERDAFRAKGEEDRAWAPPEWKHFETKALELDDPALLEASGALKEQLWRRESWAVVRKTYRRVVKALARERWSRIVDTTDDFVVFAVDTEQQDLATNLRATLPAGAFRALRPSLPV